MKIGNYLIGDNSPTFFIADIAANHDGDLARAIKLVRLAKESGANAAKFQHFSAPKIVSDSGFKALDEVATHQSNWRKSVFEVYADASLPWDWTETIAEECDKIGLVFLSTPYDLEVVELLDPLVPAFKIGSGDVDWYELLKVVASKGKPVILGTGASTFDEVKEAVKMLGVPNGNLALLQCNTNYTASDDNYDHLNLRVISSYRMQFPHVAVGLSDHTKAVSPVLGAIALGARIIERHFTDDDTRPGPDHAFAMTPREWQSMVVEARILEASLGSGEKLVESNETDSAIVQRRCIRAAHALPVGHVLNRDDLVVLRPAPAGSLSPSRLASVLGKQIQTPLATHQELRAEDLS